MSADPIPHHRRNPRRAYNRDGTMIAPATVATSLASGDETLSVHCHACGHSIVLGIAGLPDDLVLVDIPRTFRLRCRCGSRAVGVMIDVVAHYQRCLGTAGPVRDLPADYRVVPWRDVVGPERAARLVAGSERGEPALSPRGPPPRR